jgi:hypothetical protein
MGIGRRPSGSGIRAFVPLLNQWRRDPPKKQTLSMIVPDSRGVRRTPVDREGLRHPMATDRLGVDASDRRLVPVGRAANIDGLADRIDGVVQGVPVPPHADRGLIQAPADVHRSRQAMQRRLKLRRVLQDPPVHRRLVDGDAPLLPQRFELPRAQRIRHLSADTREEDVCCGVRLLAADHHRPLSQALRAGGGSSPTRWRTTIGDSAAASPSRGRHR